MLSNLLGIEGNVNDVDALKALAIASKKFAKKVKDEIGVDIKKLDPIADRDHIAALKGIPFRKPGKSK